MTELEATNHISCYVLRHAINKYGAFGTLFNKDGMPFAVTLENEETLIPVGIFRCMKSYYYRGKYETFEILVPSRSRILFHKLNWDTESKGCIGIGEAYEILDKVPGIAQSAKGFIEFWHIYKDLDEFILEVREHLIVPRSS